MDLNEYQKAAKKTAVYPDIGNNIVYPVLGLSSEAGEVAGKIKKMIRDSGGVLTQKIKDDVSSELGDVLWYLAVTASELGKDLNQIAIANIEKLESRASRGTIQGSGDNR